MDTVVEWSRKEASNEAPKVLPREQLQTPTRVRAHKPPTASCLSPLPPPTPVVSFRETEITAGKLREAEPGRDKTAGPHLQRASGLEGREVLLSNSSEKGY